MEISRVHAFFGGDLDISLGYRVYILCDNDWNIGLYVFVCYFIDGLGGVMHLFVIIGVMVGTTLVLFCGLALEDSGYYRCGWAMFLGGFLGLIGSCLVGATLYTIGETTWTTESIEDTTTYELLWMESGDKPIYLVEDNNAFAYCYLDGGTFRNETVCLDNAFVSFGGDTASVIVATTKQTRHRHWWILDVFSDPITVKTCEFRIPSRDNIRFSFEYKE